MPKIESKFETFDIKTGQLTRGGKTTQVKPSAGVIDLGGTQAPVQVEKKTNLVDDVVETPQVDDNLAGAGDRFGVNIASVDQPDDNLALQETVQSQAQKLGNKTLANKDYVNAVFKSFGGRDANEQELLEFTGKGVQDVLNAITDGLSGKKPETPKFTDIKDKTLDEKVIDTTPKTTNEVLLEGANKTLVESSEKVRKIQAEQDSFEASFAASGLVDKEDIDEIKTGAREDIKEVRSVSQLTSLANKKINKIAQKANERLSELGDEITMRDAQDVYNYTMNTIQQRMYSGLAADAQSLIKQEADNLYRNETLRISQAQLDERIDARTADDLRLQSQYDREQWQKGFAPIPVDQVDDMAYTYGATRIYTNPVTGRSYLKPEDDKLPSISEQIAAAEKGFVIEDGIIRKKGATEITSSSGKSYDLSTYAADPEAHSTAVQSILDNIGKFETIEDINDYITSNKADSEITGQMIANASTDLGIGWEELTALIQQESLLGTSNVAEKNNNPGGITWSQSYQDSHPDVNKGTARPSAEGGNYVKFDTMQEGVDAVAEQLARRVTTASNLEGDVPSDVFIAATKLVTTLTKGKGTTEYKQEIQDHILNEYKKGKTLDEIEDELRYSSVSEEFVGSFKGAFEFITKKGFSLSDREAAKDGLDELLEEGDIENAKYFMLGLARDKGTANEQKQVVGREEALLAIDSVQESLKKYTDSGGDTGLITGNLEKIQQKVFKRTGNQELANIANEIQIAIQAYRQAISGAAFTEAESKEYENIYPSIGKSKELNEAKINSLVRVYERNQGAFYRRTMGVKFYKELYEKPDDSSTTLTEEEDAKLSDSDAYEFYLKTSK